MSNKNNTPIIAVNDIKAHFTIRRGSASEVVRAVDGVSFAVNRGETLGLVGESGCGKSTVGRTIMRYSPITSGQVVFDGNDITAVDLRPYRSRMQMIFQDPYSSLDPRMTVGDIIGEPLDIQYPHMPRKERNDRILEKMNLVGMNAEHLTRFSHEFSGGQRQRISIARAMITDLEFLIADEPVSALDVSIQAQIINKLMELQSKLGVAYLFIAHDLSVVRHISKFVVVMYLGHVMESYTSKGLYAEPLHPYTQALLSSIPIPDPKRARARRRVLLQGDVPSPINPPSGCVFRTRCSRCVERCSQEAPQTRDVGDGHIVACHLV